MTPFNFMSLNSFAAKLFDKHVFDVPFSVEISSWSNLDQAGQWCEELWRDKHRRYRRRLDVENRRAIFEFEHRLDQISFALKFG